MARPTTKDKIKLNNKSAVKKDKEPELAKSPKDAAEVCLAKVADLQQSYIKVEQELLHLHSLYEGLVSNNMVSASNVVSTTVETNYFMPVDINIDLDSVLLSSDNRAKFNQFIAEQSNREKLAKYGLSPMNRILMYGESGCGKTFSTKALANKLGCVMCYVDIAQSLSSNSVAENIHGIFDYAKELVEQGKKPLVFLDECDSIAWARDARDAESGTVRRATNTLFQCMDQSSDDMVIVAATNMLHKLDAAFERRFNLKMEFTPPDKPLREIVMHFKPEDMSLEDCEPNEVLERQCKLSYYGLQDVVKRVVKQAILKDKSFIAMSDIYADIRRQQNLK